MEEKIRLPCEIKLIQESFGHFIPLKIVCWEASSCVWQEAIFTLMENVLSDVRCAARGGFSLSCPEIDGGFMGINPSARWRPGRGKSGAQTCFGQAGQEKSPRLGLGTGTVGLLGEERRVISTRARIPPREAMLHIPAAGAQRPSSRSSPGSHPHCRFSRRVLLTIIPEPLLLLFPVTEPSFLPLHENFKLYIYFCVYVLTISLPD